MPPKYTPPVRPFVPIPKPVPGPFIIKDVPVRGYVNNAVEKTTETFKALREPGERVLEKKAGEAFVKSVQKQVIDKKVKDLAKYLAERKVLTDAIERAAAKEVAKKQLAKRLASKIPIIGTVLDLATIAEVVKLQLDIENARHDLRSSERTIQRNEMALNAIKRKEEDIEYEKNKKIREEKEKIEEAEREDELRAANEREEDRSKNRDEAGFDGCGMDEWEYTYIEEEGKTVVYLCSEKTLKISYIDEEGLEYTEASLPALKKHNVTIKTLDDKFSCEQILSSHKISLRSQEKSYNDILFYREQLDEIEKQLDEIEKQLDEIEKQLDEIEKRSKKRALDKKKEVDKTIDNSIVLQNKAEDEYLKDLADGKDFSSSGTGSFGRYINAKNNVLKKQTLISLGSIYSKYEDDKDILLDRQKDILITIKKDLLKNSNITKENFKKYVKKLKLAVLKEDAAASFRDETSFILSSRDKCPSGFYEAIK